MPKLAGFPDDLAHYVEAHHSHTHDELLAQLADETRGLGDLSRMMIAPHQGALLTMLARMSHARHAVEVGTFTGTSSICIARGLAAGGHLHCFDLSEEFTAIARRYWARADVADRITLHMGNAIEMLGELPDDPIDLVFIDADKTGYDGYYEALLPRVRPGGVLVFDNMLWGGKVIDREDQTDDTRAIRALNAKLADDNRVLSALLPVADGLNVCVKK